MTEEKKYRQICREAIATGLVLAAIIVFWLFAGFGLADSGVTVLGMPLWALTSSIGTWFFAICMVKLLTTFIFKDMSLDSDEDAQKGGRSNG